MAETAADGQSSQATKLISKQPDTKKPGALDFSIRESKELILAFSGAVGSGTDQVTSVLQRLLEEKNYNVVHIKLSKFIEFLLEKKFIAGWDDEIRPGNRLEKLQIAGNLLRSQNSADFLSEIAIAVILNHRLQQATGANTAPPALESIVPNRTVYFIDQLKNPAEVSLLRKIYGNLFYLVGILTGEKQRGKNLNKQLLPQEVASAIERDRQNEDSNGQQLDKTLKLADFFVRNNDENTEVLKKPLKRFLGLIHGETSRTPTRDEYAMYVAYSAGLRSACLSRQVGAAISDADGSVISTGCNDVPKANGGLYSEDDVSDYRCIYMEGGKCFNDEHKDQLAKDIEKILNDELKDAGRAKKLVAAVRKSTRLRDLLEFSRSVHAEMDAIISIARRGGPSVTGGSLYTTTFPCHNCARHIVAAGITKVFYIEPYEKSLALELHSDAIVSDPEQSDGSKVQFLHFEGVAPRQYQELFSMKDERKKLGKAVPMKPTEAPKIRVQYLDGYRNLESKIVENLVNQGLTKEQIADMTSS
jgi:deoxycytidylate deaminase